MGAVLLGLFAACALVLASVGLFVTYSAGAMLILVVGAAAAIVPARHTTSIDPVRALHCE